MNKILKYLKMTLGHGLIFKKSWVGELTERKPTNGYCSFVWGNLVTWRSKKQLMVSRNSAEAKSRALAHGSCKVDVLTKALPSRVSNRDLDRVFGHFEFTVIVAVTGAIASYAEANTYNGSQGHIAHADATASDGGHALSEVVPKKRKRVTCGKVEARSIAEPIRNIIIKPFKGGEENAVDYDYLIIAVGAQVNTFNTPGVMENCHFLKEIEDAQKIRKNVIESFEKASLPSLSEKERKKILHFVIVGGGPTGVEFAAELHDFVNEDVVKLYPKVKDLVKITLLEATDHILNMFDKRITNFAENKFGRDGIDVKLGSMVTGINENEISTKARGNGKTTSTPYGMVLWSTGIGPRPLIKEFMKQIGQGNRRALATDEWLRVEGFDNIYALEANGDAAKESMELNIEEFKAALSEVDSQMKNLPATAQVANQQGAYLAKCFNRMEECEKNPEGPPRFRGTGFHRFHPFRYRHLGQFAPLGGEQTGAQLPGDWVSIGHSSQWLWYSVYASKQVSWRPRALVVSDWLRRFIFGRDTSGI
ncbi:External alternative NAD(P)H-ubiquinone oxidoreductase B1 [Hibiscus syriacus]|uniref:NADH:ubiquinone reductase (non-electrogenic) n=1 Tax=Hibiscus syriacus TaxID=106335 RepID=A0A6A2ZDC6_HIBSY|nr:External alternative NAD(P)H-ubiquinone oxidoreductase B1 [Hibiscus syriacus]